MGYRLTSRHSLLFLAFAAMLAFATLIAGFSVKADALVVGSLTPTISSDKADYPPGATVTLTGSNWQPGESVHINVNDEAGRTWSRDVDVTADDSGSVTDQFDLPDWFVATYKVTATGAQSGEATTSFTDAPSVAIQGKSNPDTGWQGSKLTGWKELDEFPLRLVFSKGNSYNNIVIPFDHFQSSSGSPGVQDLHGWTAGSGVTLVGTPQLTKSGSANNKWEYTLSVNVDQNASNPTLEFKGKLAAGAHSFTGASLSVGGSDVGGQQQIQQPGALPGKPDLFVDKKGPSTAAPNSTITYTLDYQNKSSSITAIGAQLTDELPSGVTYVSGCSTACTVVGNFVTWDLGNLAPGASGSRSLQVSIGNAAFGTTYTDKAHIRSAQDDINPTDNDDTLTTTVSFNRNPNAVNDSLSTNEDTANSVNVLSNDTDPDGDTLSVTSKTNGTNGTVNCTTAGVCTYTPNANFNGSDSFTYTVSDGKGGTATGTVNVTVNAVNDTPSFTKGADQTVNEDSGVQTVNNWASAISAGAGEGSQNVSFVISSNSDSSLFSSGPSISSGGTLTYTPDADKNGTATVGVKIKDDGGTPSDPSDDLLSSEQTFVITVRPVNDAPSFTKGADQTVAEDSGPHSVNPWATNISEGPSDEASQAVDFVITNNTNSALFSSGPSVSSNGTLSYTLAENKNGTATITLKIHDDGGTDNGGVNESSTQSFTITVDAVNDKPVAVNDDYSVNEDTTLTKNASDGVLGNDTDVEGSSLSAVLVAGPSHGTLTLDPNGSISYTPDNNYNGPDSFTYKANDGALDSNVATVNINVRSVNDAPVANDDNYNVNEDGTLNVPDGATDVLDNDIDGDGDSLTADLISDPAHGQLTHNANGSFTYTPDADYNGPDSFTYKANDGTDDSNTATVNITVNAVNDKPVGTNDTRTTPENTPLLISTESLTANDNTGAANESGQNLLITEVSDAQHGTVSLDSGQITFTPEQSYNGTEASFLYKLCDNGQPQECSLNKVVVDITVTEVNDPPVANGDSITVAEDGEKTFDATSNDSTGPANESTQTLTVDSIVSAPDHGTASKNSDGTIKYVPDADYNGPDSFTYKVCDDGMTNGSSDPKCDIGTVTVDVTPVNDAPVAEADSYTTSEDNSLVVGAGEGVLSNDSDIDSANLTAELKTGPSHGTLVLNPDGSFTYTPNANFSGDDTFTYTVSDGAGGAADATVTVHIHAVNDAPVASNDAYGVDEDDTLNIAEPGVLGNDTDVDSSSLTAVLVSGPTHGTLNLDPNGSFIYTPDADFNGTDEFTYKTNDGALDSNNATVTINVRSVNDAPVANNDNYNVDEDTPTNLAVLSNDTDADGDSLTSNLVSGPSHGTLTHNANGSFSYTPDNNYNGPDSFTYKANDGALDSNIATVTITVRPVNDAPAISSVTADGPSINEGSSTTVKATASDPDTPSSSLSYSFDCNGDENYTDTGDKGPQAADSASCAFDDGPGTNPPYKVNVRVTDGAGGSDTDFTNVEVKNIAPTITDITASPQMALLNQNITFTGTATDPSVADTNDGFTWQWSKDGVVQTSTTTKVLQTSFNTCGPHTVGATAKDKDNGVSPLVTKSNVVNVLEANFRPPIDGPATNLTQKGKVIPVKIYAGCNTIVQPGLTPNIKLLNGDQRAGTEGANDAIEAYSTSAADSTGWMRPVDGGYIYNLLVPGGTTVAVGQEFTVRVYPLATSANPTAGPAMYAVLKIKK